MNKTEDLRNLNVYAEVRGKYARPPPPNYKPYEIPLLTPKENTLLSRPLTADTLRSKSISNSKPLPQQPVSEKKKEITPYRKKYRSVQPNPDLKATNEPNRLVIEHPEDLNQNHIDNDLNYPESNQDDNDQGIENTEKKENNLEKNSQFSELTTTSQRKYILELEGLLREERFRRIKLEEFLRKVTEENQTY
jgi:hypothetical protein